MLLVKLFSENEKYGNHSMRYHSIFFVNILKIFLVANQPYPWGGVYMNQV